MDTCICMAESLFSPSETITTLLIAYTPIQNEKLRKKKKAILKCTLANLGDIYIDSAATAAAAAKLLQSCPTL